MTTDRVIGHQRWLWERAQGDSLSKHQEAELAELRDFFLARMTAPAGRTLWLGGTEVVKRREASNFNCAFLEVRTVHDLVDAFWLLLQGCGVGFKSIAGTLSGFTRKMEVQFIRSTHKIGDPKDQENNTETYDPNTRTWTIKIGDSAEAWAKSIGKLAAGKFPAKKLIIDSSPIRAPGTRLKGYGWICNGDRALIVALEAICGIFNQFAGKLLTKKAIWHVINWLGTVLSNRRSAQIGLIDYGDKEWYDIATMKPPGFDKDERWFLTQSNNSLLFYDKPARRQLNDLFEMMIANGGAEPGFVNMEAGLKRAPWMRGLNPCATADTLVYTADGRRGITIGQLANEGKDVPVFCVDRANKLTVRMMRHPRLTGVRVKILKVELDNGQSVRVTPNHKFRMRDGSYKEARDLVPGDSLAVLTQYVPEVCEGESYSDKYVSFSYQNNQHPYEHQLIAEWFYGREILKDEHVHHVDSNRLNNRPNNLKIKPAEAHLSEHSAEDNNPRYSGFTNEELLRYGRNLVRSLGRRFSQLEWRDLARTNGLPLRFSEWRTRSLGTFMAFARRCAMLEGVSEYEADKDPRLVRTYQTMIEAGLDAEIVDNQVLVHKACELCGGPFTVDHERREQGFCSVSCGNRGKKIDKKKLRANLAQAHADRKVVRREQQLEVYTKLKAELGRSPEKKEWMNACKVAGISAEISRPSSPFTSWAQLTEAAKTFNHRVVAVSEDGIEDVYNGTVDECHNFFVGGWDEGLTERGRRKSLWVNNLQCGEVLLASGGVCNLSELDVAAFRNDDVGMLRAMHLLARANYRQTCVNLRDGILQDFWHQTNEFLRLCGTGLTGIVRRPDLGPYDYRKLALTATHGAYSQADELRMPRPANVTVIKPSGTLSKAIFDTTEGAHYPDAQHIINLTSFSRHDKTVEKLLEAGYWLYDHPLDPDSVLAALPVAYDDVDFGSPDGINRETAVSQLERYRMLQNNYVQQNTSITVSYKPEEKKSLVNWFDKNWHDYVACSFLFRQEIDFGDNITDQDSFWKFHCGVAEKRGFSYMPQVAVDKDTYARYASSLAQLDFEQDQDGSLDNELVQECASGACPLR